MAGNEEGRLEIVFLEQPEQAGNADLAGEDAALDVRGRIRAAIGADPACDGIDVRPERADDFLLGHFQLPFFATEAAGPDDDELKSCHD